MIPSVLSSQIRRGVEDFLSTTFPITNPFFSGALEELLRKPGGVFQGPYVSVTLPFLKGNTGKTFFPEVMAEDFEPHRHQEIAFERLASLAGRSTLIATGTGSGKTECFLYPILDHCFRNRGKKGIKAILIYPMNALATDQAKRLARAIHASEYLRGYVTAGLLIGGLEEEASKVMGEDRLITDRDTMRQVPPDILLTNYRMLDYLLVRPRDFGLWKDNEPETLRYLVVDELHTFDGAQAADLACLVRRMKERLKTPPEHLIAVGTSATLGKGDASFRPEDLLGYARQVFGEPFEEDSIVGEFVQTPEKFLRGHPVKRFQFPEPQETEILDPIGYEGVEDYVRAQHRAWFGKDLGDYEGEPWRIELSDRLKGHGFFRNLLAVLDGRALDFHKVLEALRPGVPGASDADPTYLARLLESFLALLSEARVSAGERLTPLVQVRYQLWLRELRRMVGSVPSEGRPKLAFADDLKPEELQRSLPVIHCRECGLTGWGGTVRDADERIFPDLQLFYSKFFAHSPQTRFLFPGDLASQDGQLLIPTFLCTSCLRLVLADKAARCQSCGADASTQLAVWVPNTNRRAKGKAKGPLQGTHDCPSCGGYNSLTILGSRAASLTSVIVAQLFSSPFNDDKKLLAFSDSVQDASHRAGFFAARTFRFTLRGAIQRVVDEAAGPVPFRDFVGRFLELWRERLSEPEFLTTFLPPDMDWLEEYEELREKGALPPDARLPRQVERRLDWEIWSEYTFNCRIGRTLEKTGASVLEHRHDALDAVVVKLLPSLREHVGALRELDADRLTRFLGGLLIHLKNKGAVDQAEIGPYLDSRGDPFLLGKGRKQVHRPNFSRGSRAPVFVTSQPYGRFQTFIRSGGATTRTWFEDWLSRCFSDLDGGVDGFAREIFEIVVKALVDGGIFFERAVKGSLLWGLRPDEFQVTTEVAQLRCGVCSFSFSTGTKARAHFLGGPCLRYRCDGRLEEEPETQDYYRRLYKSGDIARIFATEHTGLLDRKTREAVELGFIHQSRPADPNLLSCTPTLEMGINIGDLSTLALCSVPPKPSNYVQRVGRAGRMDGNSLVIAIANARAHDLFFYFEPEEMIQGQVEPPGCFLNASAVLERQLTGFAFDRWVETGLSEGALPERLAPVLDAVERGDEKAESFPWSFLRFYEIHRTELEERFLSLFQDDIQDFTRDRIREFARGGGEGKGLEYRIREGLQEVVMQRKSQRNRIRRLSKKISELESDPAKGKHYEAELHELKQEKAALNALVKSMNDRHVLEFMTTEGLLPNYAFPEAGVVLRSVIYRREEGDAGGGDRYTSRIYSYERPAAAAIRELAPANSFYAQGRKLVVDQVNLDLSELEPWRFCASCTYMAREGETEPFKTCPRCQSPLWADEGQRKNMLRMREVNATSSERASRSHDESEEREPHFFQKNMFVLKEDDDITSAFAVEEEAVPFGFEFFRKMTLREVNFGEAEGSTTTTIGNREIVDNPFKICKGCGKVEGIRKELHHAPYCRYRGSEEKTKVFEASYLYREVTSEAIRMLLPVATFEVERYVESFVAGLDLGLRRKFRGDPGHLLTTVYDEPIPGSDIRKRFLVLYDGVPGGTGYLKELMQSPDILMEVFQFAYDVMASCPCQKDEQKDGCYRCLFAYRRGHDRDNTSRAKAMELFGAILERRDRIQVIDRIDKIRLNSLLESELEGRFIEALRRPEGREPAEKRQLSHAVVRGKQGWHFKLGNASYLIEPQVELGTNDGVSMPCRADFVFHPERPLPGELPIVVFTDGYEYHADPEAHARVGLDTAQRLAILRSGRFRVWSLTWDDVQERFEPSSITGDRLAPNPEAVRKLIERVDSPHSPEWMDLLGGSSFDLLLFLLGKGRARSWTDFAQCYGTAFLSESPGTLDDVRNLRSAFLDATQTSVDDWKPTSGDWVVGVHDRADGSVMGFAAAEKTGLQRGHLEGVGGIFRLYDEGVSCERDVWKGAWRNFLRLMNVLQFTGTFDFVTSSGLRQERYGSLLDVPWFARRRVAEDVPEAVLAILDVADPSVHGVVRELGKEGVALPEAGLEIVDENGEIVGMAELGWEDARVAVFLKGQEYDHGRFRAAGWKTFFVGDVADDMDTLLSVLKGAKA